MELSSSVRIAAIRVTRLHHYLLLSYLKLNNNLVLHGWVPRHHDFSGLAKGWQNLGSDKEVVRKVDPCR